jgi:glycosyltransferase involved in cell wall biosynthesis
MISYGSDCIQNADQELLGRYGLEPGKYCLVIARAEPENSIFEIVNAFSRKARGFKLVVLGDYNPAKNRYHKKVTDSASDEVIFSGAIYEKSSIQSLRYFCRLYIHGHRVGGTNPSLVEALGAGSAILAHDNRFNRWVAGGGAHYFKGLNECAEKLDEILDDDHELERMRNLSLERHKEEFTWEEVLAKYEALLLKILGSRDAQAHR